MRRPLLIVAVVALLSGLLAAPATSQELPPTPDREFWYAENDTRHWSAGDRVRLDQDCLDRWEAEEFETVDELEACQLKAFESKPFTVIAFVDTGINPYHHDFRAEEFTFHPSEYLSGFPEDAEAVEVSLDIADSDGYDIARLQDSFDGVWSLSRNELYWFPGTRVIGAYSTGSGDTSEGYFERVVLDDQGHGTGVASVAAGQYYGSNPNALIVAVEGLGSDSLAWAASQQWIDIVSNSWGITGNVPSSGTIGPTMINDNRAVVEMTRQSTERGQSMLFSAGNGATNTNSHQIFPIGPVEDPCECKTPDSNPSITSPYNGPSWVMKVGAASPINGQAHWWHSVPVDVASFGSKWRSATAFEVTFEDGGRDFGGTSCAAPTTAGVLSSLIERAREVFDDTTEGQRDGRPGVVAEAAEGADLPDSGPLADGVLTREEAEEIVMKTAFPVEADPEELTWDYAVRPTTPAYYAYQGYGLVDRDSKARAHEVLMGEAPLAERAEAEQWNETWNAASDAFWTNL